VRAVHIIAAVWLMLAGAVAAAHAEKRVALVVGNDRYANLGANEQLQKAVNDARAVGGALKGIGFDVIAGENLDRRTLVRKLGELTQRLEPGDTAFFFFSGHGVALDGINYILPADVPDVAPGQDTSLKGEALSEPYIISELTGRGVRVAVVVLDACRTNPFSRPGGKSVGAARGLVAPPQAQGVFSLYAAANGQSALDRLYDGDPDPNSVFSRVLVPLLKKPGLDLTALAFEVREEVAKVAQHAGYAQRPAYYDETIGGRVYLAGAPPDGGQPPREPAVSGAAERAAMVWRDIQTATSLAVLDDFLRQFGDVPVYGPLARMRREEVVKSQQAVVVTPPPPQSPALPHPDTLLTEAQERGLKPKDTFRECADCPEMVVVPAGAFTMGSPGNEEDRNSNEGPQHVVMIRKLFAVGEFHVTVDQYKAFVLDTGYEKSRKCHWSSPGFVQNWLRPVVCVRWEDAAAYVAWLAKKTGKPYRLLSEAEWEYAARGRTSPGAYPRFWFGDDEKDLCRYGNGADQTGATPPGLPIAPCKDGYTYTSPAGHYAPNAFGLYDMFGNAWQWTADCWHTDYSGAPADGSAWTSGDCSGRVARGGSWFSIPGNLRAALRLRLTDEDNDIGFRLARTLTP
jgi:formylglycine-generating enzyme required for sulfatase activity